MFVFETFKMRFTSITVLLVSLVASIHAGVVPREADGVLESREVDLGKITTYRDIFCKDASATFDVSVGGVLSGKMGLDTKGIVANLPCDGTLSRTIIDVFAQICKVN